MGYLEKNIICEKKLKNQEAELHLIDILFVLKFCSHSKQIF